MLAAYDFRPLDEPMSREERTARRKAILDGRSPFSAMELEHWAFLMVMVVPWLVWAFFALALPVAVITWVAENGQSLEWFLGVLLTVAVVLGGGALCVVLTRLCIIPPRWRSWARMHRFAEVNGLVFIRASHGVELPSGVVLPGRMPPRIFDSFADPETGFILGNWVRPTVTGRGIADWRAYIVIPARLVGGEADLPDEKLIGGFEATHNAVALSATRFPSVRMRNSITIRRMFATAEALRARDYDPRNLNG